jgi:hypothetical protein
LNRFINYVRANNLHTEDAPEYTPNLGQAENVFDLPFYDPDNRHYELMVDEVALYNHEMADVRARARLFEFWGSRMAAV